MAKNQEEKKPKPQFRSDRKREMKSKEKMKLKVEEVKATAPGAKTFKKGSKGPSKGEQKHYGKKDKVKLEYVTQLKNIY